MEATATDACVVLGYIDPDYFLGGRRRLDAGIARDVIEEKVAKPLGLPVEKCSRLIAEAMEDICAEGIGNLINKKGYKPDDFALFSFGGAGGLYCCGVADKVGIPRVYCFQFSSVFSAFGSSCADVQHSYESFSRISIKRQLKQSQIAGFNELVKGLMNSASRDMRGEGFSPDKVYFSLELEIESGTDSVLLECPVLLIEKQGDVDKILDAFAGQNDGNTVDELKIKVFRLRATSPAAHPELVSYKSIGKNPEKALKEHRDVYWKDDYIQTEIYRQSKLECGNVISGPAIVESDDTTILIPRGKKYTVDNLLNGVIEPV